MSDFRGTIGSPEGDPVIAWIYTNIEGLPKQTRNDFLKAVQRITDDHRRVVEVKDKKFRNRVALLVLNEQKQWIGKLVSVQHMNLEQRLRGGLLDRMLNVAVRNYREILRMK